MYERVRALVPLMRDALGLGLGLGNSLDRKECTRAHTRITELPKIKRRLIRNNTPEIVKSQKATVKYRYSYSAIEQNYKGRVSQLKQLYLRWQF